MEHIGQKLLLLALLCMTGTLAWTIIVMEDDEKKIGTIRGEAVIFVVLLVLGMLAVIVSAYQNSKFLGRVSTLEKDVDVIAHHGSKNYQQFYPR